MDSWEAMEDNLERTQNAVGETEKMYKNYVDSVEGH
jgi:hypothetical protein